MLWPLQWFRNSPDYSLHTHKYTHARALDSHSLFSWINVICTLWSLTDVSLCKLLLFLTYPLSLILSDLGRKKKKRERRRWKRMHRSRRQKSWARTSWRGWRRRGKGGIDDSNISLHHNSETDFEPGELHCCCNVKSIMTLVFFPEYCRVYY